MTSGRRPIIALACAAAAAGIAGCGGGKDDQRTQRAAAATPAPQMRAVSQPDDAEAADASPIAADQNKGPSAPTPSKVGEKSAAKAASSDEQMSISPGAPSDAEIRAELGEMEKVQKQARKDALRAGPSGTLDLTAKANAVAPAGAPSAVAAIIGSANAIARFPYVYGGGHGSFIDTAYDCSGSVSYALAGAGLLNAPLTSGDLAKWGDPGPGRWVTIYANAGHVFMYVAGTRYDTSGRSGTYGSRWSKNPRSLAGFTVRHPPGL